MNKTEQERPYFKFRKLYTLLQCNHLNQEKMILTVPQYNNIENLRRHILYCHITITVYIIAPKSTKKNSLV